MLTPERLVSARRHVTLFGNAASRFSVTGHVTLFGNATSRFSVTGHVTLFGNTHGNTSRFSVTGPTPPRFSVSHFGLFR